MIENTEEELEPTSRHKYGEQSTIPEKPTKINKATNKETMTTKTGKIVEIFAQIAIFGFGFYLSKDTNWCVVDIFIFTIINTTVIIYIATAIYEYHRKNTHYISMAYVSATIMAITLAPHLIADEYSHPFVTAIIAAAMAIIIVFLLTTKKSKRQK